MFCTFWSHENIFVFQPTRRTVAAVPVNFFNFFVKFSDIGSGFAVTFTEIVIEHFFFAQSIIVTYSGCEVCFGEKVRFYCFRKQAPYAVVGKFLEYINGMFGIKAGESLVFAEVDICIIFGGIIPGIIDCI